MTLRRLERLISDARDSSNTSDVDSITDKLLTLYSNRVQSMIEDLIFMSNSINNIFMFPQSISLVQGQTDYDLPFDIYAKSAIKSVGIEISNGYGIFREKIDFIPESESGNKFGYSLKESKIVFNFQRAITDPIVVNYVRKIPTLGKRFGKVSAASGQTLTVPATASTELLDNYDDFFTAVDVDGAIVARNLRIVSYVYSTGVITFSGGTGTAVVGNYIIPGKYATSHSQLPDECEKIFLEVLERRIAQRQSQADTMSMIEPLTEHEVSMVEAVFAKGSEDNEVPPTSDFSEFC